MDRGFDLCPAAIAAAMVALLLLCGGCQSDDFKPDPNPKESLSGAEQALKTIRRWLDESNAPKWVVDALVDLQGHLKQSRTDTDSLVDVHVKREQALKARIAELESTIWERSLMGWITGLCVLGIIGGALVTFSGPGSIFARLVGIGPATIWASVIGIFAIRFVEATRPMAMIIGYSVGVCVAVLLGYGVYLRIKAMRDKAVRDTKVIEIGEQNRELAAAGKEPIKSLKDIARSMPDLSTPAVKQLTKKVRKQLGYQKEAA